MSNLNVRANLKPNEAELQYTITTQDVETYIQLKVNAIVNGLKEAQSKNGNTNYQVPNHQPIRIVSMECGKVFLPFLVLLPTSMLQGSNQRKHQNRGNELSLFNPVDDNSAVRLQDAFFKFFQMYTFSKDDVKLFNSPKWKNDVGLYAKAPTTLREFRMPSVRKVDDGNKYVMFMLDPIRVFHDMLTGTENAREPFSVNIKSVTKIKGGSYSYKTLRVVNRGKNQPFDIGKLERLISSR